MPEAAIHEDGHTSGGEDQVGSNSPSACINRVIDSESQALAVQLGADRRSGAVPVRRFERILAVTVGAAGEKWTCLNLGRSQLPLLARCHRGRRHFALERGGAP